MTTRLRKGILRRRFVKSDSGGVIGGGFAVKVRIRGLSYEEGSHSLKVAVEPLRGKAGWVIYLDTVEQWEPPFEKEALTSEQVFQIRRNIAAALEKMGIKFSAPGLPGTV